jgi:Protein of unknown function (DUF3099)
MRRSHTADPVLITSAPVSGDAEYDRRRKKYAIMMGLRALAVLGAALSYRFSFVLAMAFVVAGIVLPWCAVLIANERPARKRAAPVPPVEVRRERALPPAGEERIVDM